MIEHLSTITELPVDAILVEDRLRDVNPATLDGLRPGILENGKANARLVMETIVDGMREHFRLGELTVGSKPVAGPPSDSTVNLLKGNCDFMVVGSSD